MISRREIEKEFVRIIKSITKLDDEFIRISYQSKGAPAPLPDSNYIYVSVSPFDSEYDKVSEKTREYDKENDIILVTRSSTTGIKANFVFYGDRAFDYALAVKNLIVDHDITRNLRKNRIFLIPGIEAPRRVPEKLNVHYSEAVYLDVRFYMSTQYVQKKNYIEKITINLIPDIGEEKNININKGD